MNDFDKYYDNFRNEIYLIQTHSQAKTSGTQLLEVHRVQKGLDPNLRPVKQHAIPKLGQIREATGGSRKSMIKEEET